ncbi:SpoIIE family protein phosphatase [Pseudokineococcus sp. 5B2Z-1]|uniref:PP2C family protein-serine/threonine phosphatase n=1 Tax=Pseudokineococcus sp. 5B2Z-1 TaxID=3132744 RepID=UPI00309AF97A
MTSDAPSRRGDGPRVPAEVVPALVSAGLAVPAWRAPQALLDAVGPAAGAVRAELLLVDHQLVELHRLARWTPHEEPDDGGDGEELAHLVDADDEGAPGGVAGAAAVAFREQRAVVAPDGLTTCQPVTVRGHRLGVLLAEAHAPGPPVRACGAVLAAAAPAVALVLRQAAEGSDAVEVRRRSHVFSVAAEMQWDVLPPTEHRAPGVELAALVEPAYLATSDLFDWAVDDDVLTLALLEAAGEGLAAARAADLALAAVRHARRCGMPLEEQAATADDVLRHRSGGDERVGAVLVRVDLRTGEASVVVAGEVSVLRWTAGGPDADAAALEELDLLRGPALGDGDADDRSAATLPVAAGDRLVLASSGVLEARSPEGRPFGAAGVAGALRRAVDVLDAPRLVARAVTDHAGGDVVRDATCVVARWGDGVAVAEPAGPQVGAAPGA